VSSDLRQLAAELPLLPGIYRFLNKEGEVLYVGKATRLRERVRSYFATDLEATRGPGLVRMVQEAITIEHEVTASELDALLLEARQIRAHKPRYNIRLRDDKSFALIRIDLSLAFPTVTVAREKDLEDLLARRHRQRAGEGRVSQRIDHQEFFGPYLSAHGVKMALKTLRKIWQFRDCSPTKYKAFADAGHGCLYATLKLCSAPCALKISQEAYRRDIDQIRQVLRGDKASVIRTMLRDMEIAAAEERYEAAALLRNRIQALQHIQDVASAQRTISVRRARDPYDPEKDIRVECFDISNNQGTNAVASCIVGVVRNAKVEPVETAADLRSRFFLDTGAYKKFRVKTVEGASDVDSLKEVVSRRLARYTQDGWALPDLLVVDGGLGQLHAVEAIRGDVPVALGAVAKGPTRRRVDLYGAWDVLGTISLEGKSILAELLREEAHRFAIRYYRDTHRKAMLRSTTR